MKPYAIFIASLCLLSMARLTTTCHGQDRTITEQLIHKEIMRLGGEWEGYLPVRIALSSGKFTEQHLEMLEHVRPFKMLDLYQVEVGVEAMNSLSKLEKLEWLDMEDSTIDAKGSEKLANLKSLKNLRLEDCKAAPEWIRAIGEIPTLTQLTLNDTDLPSGTLEIVARLKNLEHLWIDSTREFKAEEIEKLKAALPMCKIKVVQSPERHRGAVAP